MSTCEYCGRVFNSIKTLKKHQLNAEYCKATRYISFICSKCNYVSKDMKTMEVHAVNCPQQQFNTTVDTLPTKIMQLEDQKMYYEKKSGELESELMEMNEELAMMRLKLQMEEFKSNIYYNIIKSNTDINIDNVFQVKSDSIQINNFQSGNIPIIVRDYITGTSDNYNIIMKKKKSHTKTTYRTVKNKVPLAIENPEEQEEKIRKVDDDIKEIVQENFDISQTDILNNIEELFNQLIKHKIYTKFLPQITAQRVQLLGKMPLTNYIELVKEHLNRIKKIFRDKNYDDKKITAILNKKAELSPLEQRLLFFNKYYNSRIEGDDIQCLKLSLKVNSIYCKRFVPFVRDDLYKSLYNYTIALFTVKDTLKRQFINPYGYSNIIYLDLGKETDDPYSFYTLEKIEDDGRRCWKLECRVDNFSHDLAYHVKKYCITLFRKIYYDIFNDNVYRENYVDTTAITQQDCEQLLQNILVLSNTKQFCNMLRNMLMKYCKITPTSLDKFNLTADDRLQKKQFASFTDDPEEVVSSIKQLFDGISNDDIQTVIDRIQN